MDNKSTAPKPEVQSESLTELLKQIADDTAMLVREEVALVKLEFSQKFTSLRSGVIVAALGAVFAVIGLATIWAAFVIWIAGFLPPEAAAAVSGGGLALIGAILAFLGLKALRKPFSEPVKSVEALQGRT
jgi:hypothetical protein